MLIRQQQMDALCSRRKAIAMDDIAQYLMSTHPAHCASFERSEMIELIDAAESRLRRYKVVDGLAAMIYIELSLLFGKDFERENACQWAADIFRGRESDVAAAIIDMYGMSKMHRPDQPRRDEIEA